MKNYIILGGFVFLTIAGFAQSEERQIIGSYGGIGTNSAFTVSQTVGDLVVTTSSNSSFVVTQGFQQTGINSTGILENELLSDLKVYPNPTANRLVIEFNSAEKQRIDIEVLTISGKLVQSPVTSFNAQGASKKEIDLSYLSSGNYLIKLTNNKITLGTLKIIKN